MTSRARRGNVRGHGFRGRGGVRLQARAGRGAMGHGHGRAWDGVLGGFSQVQKPESFLYSEGAGRCRRVRLSHRRGMSTPTIPIPTSTTSGTMASSTAIASSGESRPTTSRRAADYRSRARTARRRWPWLQQTPSLPLASFYNAENQFVWPADSPTAGELKEKRSIFDQASQAVLTETKKSGVASIATVTDARQKLLDYGRPALQFVRTHETPRIADTFHLFLLSTYESLAQAVNPPATAAAATSTPAPFIRERAGYDPAAQGATDRAMTDPGSSATGRGE